MPEGEREGPAISACLLCYNDAPTIRDLVAAAGSALDAVGRSGEIVVVNDGSTDDSATVLGEAMAAEPRLRVITHERNSGYGAAVRSALEAARGDWIFYTDGDGQYDPAELELLAARTGEDVDVVQGFKAKRSDPFARRVVGEVYRVVVGAAFRLPIRDVDCDFRLMRASVVHGVDLKQASGAICVELVVQLKRAGARFTEVEVSHHERVAGESQFFTPRKVARALAGVAALWATLVAAPALRRLWPARAEKRLQPQ